MKAIASIEIIDNAGTYLKEGSILQVFMDQEWTLFAVEEYEKGSPCQHPLNDLMDDEIKFKFVMTEQFEALGQQPLTGDRRNDQNLCHEVCVNERNFLC